MKNKTLFFAVAVAAATLLGGMSDVFAAANLSGTHCWKIASRVGEPTFLSLSFSNVGNNNAIVSGTAVLSDGDHPDRVLQLSGSTSRNTFVGEFPKNSGIFNTIDRHLMDLHYSFSKTGENLANAFAETGRALRGHYSVRLDPTSLDGIFEGNDVIIDWAKPLTGPSVTYSHDDPRNTAFQNADPNNSFGGILCDGSLGFGRNNCGTIIMVNNTGTLTKLADDKNACNAIAANLPLP